MSILGEQITSIHDNVDKLLSRINSNTKGKEKVGNTSIQPPPEIRYFKLKDFSDLESLLEKRFKGCSLKPLGTDDFSGGESNYKKEFSDEINKISEKYVRKVVQRMYYYPRPTPQDVLLEDHEHIITNSYNRKEIYEWNIDGYTDRQIYTTVHRMLMYKTIYKANKNSDKTIAAMITTGFTGQLKAWWDNYLNTEQRDKILQSVKQEREHNLTQNGYGAAECNSSHWKSKFIDGLPALFAERVRKTLRGDSHSINYDNCTHGKLISAFIQEGLSLCNEIKLNQQVKKHHLNERQQLGEFREQLALDIPKASSKELKHSSKNKSSKKDYKA
ncbi:hypothetical protein KY284_036167 [Solanum tuberosum]|nr:hypothetical protein KY284_036167 [Solanum tuberosum]